MEDPSGSGLLMIPDDFLKVFQCICDQNVIRESKKASNKDITINRSDEPTRFKRWSTAYCYMIIFFWVYLKAREHHLK